MQTQTSVATSDVSQYLQGLQGGLRIERNLSARRLVVLENPLSEEQVLSGSWESFLAAAGLFSMTALQAAVLWSAVKILAEAAAGFAGWIF